MSKASLRIEASPGRVSVYRGEASEPILVQNAEEDRRPYIHPIVSPDGIGVVTENSPSHHLWQHGLYVGLNDVNGVGFWSEGLAKTGADTDGSFHPHILGNPEADENHASWAISTEYRSPAGDPILDETQDWILTDEGDHYVLDLVWTLKGRVAVRFGKYPYGGLFLRMPWRAESGGSAINSSGQNVAEADGERAKWVAVQMPIEGGELESQVAMMDHPQNLAHPVPWRVDHQLGVSPSASIAGEWHLHAGEERTFLHRVVVYASPVDPSVIEESWTSFSERGSA